MENKNQKRYTPNIENLIALSYILNDYEDFISQLNDIIKTKNSTEVVITIEKLINGEKVPFNIGKIKKFYKNNKEVIDTINKYSNLGIFINCNYNWKGDLNQNYGLEFFYHYMIEHLEEIDRIREILRKLKELEFISIEFDSTKDFTKEVYSFDRNFTSNFRIEYLDNIEVIPNYEYNRVKYKTTGSSFKITAGISGDEIASYDRSITVTDFLFDPKKLPDQLTKESLFNSITDVKEHMLDSCSQLRNSVDMGVNIDDLISQYKVTSYKLKNLTDIKDKEKLEKILKKLEKLLQELKKISTDYDENTSSSNAQLPSELLSEEKKQYVKRRNYAALDLD